MTTLLQKRREFLGPMLIASKLPPWETARFCKISAVAVFLSLRFRIFSQWQPWSILFSCRAQILEWIIRSRKDSSISSILRGLQRTWWLQAFFPMICKQKCDCFHCERWKQREHVVLQMKIVCARLRNKRPSMSNRCCGKLQPDKAHVQNANTK